MNKILLFLLLSGMICQEITAQERSDEPRHLSLQVDYQGYFKNNEYTANYARGYTLTGNHLTPLLEYRAGERMSLRAGVHLLKYSGMDDFSEARPFLSLALLLRPDFHLTFGSYRIPQRHRLSEIIFSDEKVFTDYVEEGFRLRYNTSGAFAEAWLNWEQFIFHHDPFQEHFTAGFSGEYNLFEGHTVKGDVTGQLLASHKGGEIDTSPLPVSTIINTYSAFSLSYLPNFRFADDIRFTAAFLTFNDVNGNGMWDFKNGNAQLYELALINRQHTFKGGVFVADDFIAPQGHPLFQSASREAPVIISNSNIMPFLDYTYEKQYFRGLSMLLSLQGFFPENSRKVQYSYQLKLVFNRSFFMSSVD